jgi:hypothetical protein
MPGGTGANGVVYYPPSDDVVAISSGSRNRVEIGSIVGSALPGAVVHISTGASNLPTQDNFVRVGASDFAYQNAYVEMDGANTVANTVEGGSFRGEVFQPESLWFASTVGGGNRIVGARGYGSTATTGCDASNASNVLQDDWTTLARTGQAAIGYGVVPETFYCTRKKVSWSNFDQLSAERGAFANGATANSSTYAIYTGTFPSVSILEPYDRWLARIAGFKSGTAGAGPIQAGFWGCAVNSNIPANATTWLARFEASLPGTNTISCRLEIQSDSSTTPLVIGTGIGFTSWSSSGNWGITLGKMAGSDTAQMTHAEGGPASPFYDNTGLGN